MQGIIRDNYDDDDDDDEDNEDDVDLYLLWFFIYKQTAKKF